MTSPDAVDSWQDSWREELPALVTRSSELTKRIMLLAHVLEEAVREELAHHQLTHAEFDVLVALRRAGSPYRLKPAGLARSLMLSSGGTTNVTRRLVDRGFLSRDDDPGDARSTWLALTPSGREVAEQAVLACARAYDSLLRDVPDAVLGDAAAALRALMQADPILTRKVRPARPP